MKFLPSHCTFLDREKKRNLLLFSLMVLLHNRRAGIDAMNCLLVIARLGNGCNDDGWRLKARRDRGLHDEQSGGEYGRNACLHIGDC